MERKLFVGKNFSLKQLGLVKRAGFIVSLKGKFKYHIRRSVLEIKIMFVSVFILSFCKIIFKINLKIIVKNKIFKIFF